MQFDKGSLESDNIAADTGLKQSNFSTWAGIRSAIPGHLKSLDDDRRKLVYWNFAAGKKCLILRYVKVNNSMNSSLQKRK